MKSKLIQRIDSCCILIPFHHREDLLISTFKTFETVFRLLLLTMEIRKVIGVHWQSAHPHLECVRTKRK